jgi:hypothetical protein
VEGWRGSVRGGAAACESGADRDACMGGGAAARRAAALHAWPQRRLPCAPPHAASCPRHTARAPPRRNGRTCRSAAPRCRLMGSRPPRAGPGARLRLRRAAAGALPPGGRGAARRPSGAAPLRGGRAARGGGRGAARRFRTFAPVLPATARARSARGRAWGPRWGSRLGGWGGWRGRRSAARGRDCCDEWCRGAGALGLAGVRGAVGSVRRPPRGPPAPASAFLRLHGAPAAPLSRPCAAPGAAGVRRRPPAVGGARAGAPGVGWGRGAKGVRLAAARRAHRAAGASPQRRPAPARAPPPPEAEVTSNRAGVGQLRWFTWRPAAFRLKVQRGRKDDVALDAGARLVEARRELGVADALERARHLWAGVEEAAGFCEGSGCGRLANWRLRQQGASGLALDPCRPAPRTCRSSSSSRRTARTRLPSNTSAIFSTSRNDWPSVHAAAAFMSSGLVGRGGEGGARGQAVGTRHGERLIAASRPPPALSCRTRHSSPCTPPNPPAPT